MAELHAKRISRRGFVYFVGALTSVFVLPLKASTASAKAVYPNISASTTASALNFQTTGYSRARFRELAARRLSKAELQRDYTVSKGYRSHRFEPFNPGGISLEMVEHRRKAELENLQRSMYGFQSKIISKLFLTIALAPLKAAKWFFDVAFEAFDSFRSVNNTAERSGSKTAASNTIKSKAQRHQLQQDKAANEVKKESRPSEREWRGDFDFDIPGSGEVYDEVDHTPGTRTA